MDRRTVFLMLASLHVSLVVGQAPYLKAENQCGALYDRKLFYVCSAGASLRSARQQPDGNPLTDAVMKNAQTLLNKAAGLLGQLPGGREDPAEAPAEAPAEVPAEAPVLPGTAPSVLDQLKHNAHTLSVSGCIIQNSVDIINDVIKSLEAAALPEMSPIDLVAPSSEDGSSNLDSISALIDAIPVDPIPAAPIPVDAIPAAPIPVDPIPAAPSPVQPNPAPEAVPETPALEPVRPPPGSTNPDPTPPSVETSTTQLERLEFLNSTVDSLSKQIADLLQNLGISIMTPHRSQAFIKLARAPLEEIRQIQSILARSEGAEQDDIDQAEAIIKDLEKQHAALKRLMANPDELTTKLTQPKEQNSVQTLVVDLKALKKTVTKMLPSHHIVRK